MLLLSIVRPRISLFLVAPMCSPINTSLHLVIIFFCTEENLKVHMLAHTCWDCILDNLSSKLYFVTVQLIWQQSNKTIKRLCFTFKKKVVFKMSAERAKRFSKANAMDKMVACSGDHVGSSSITEKNSGQLNSFTIHLADETWLHVFSHLSQQDIFHI